MKHQSEVIIDAAIDAVWQAFDDPGNARRWQPTLDSVKHESGERGQPGAVSSLVYADGDVVMQTVTERREPHFMAMSRESARGASIVVNHFEALDEGRTKWVVYRNMRFAGLAKLLAPFKMNAIAERFEDDMQRFKLMVESDQAA